MPLERKILLTILVILTFAFGGYLFYTGYYTQYKDNLSKITKYEKLINGFKTGKLTVSADKIEKLTRRESELKKKFFSMDEADITVLTPYIKKLLIKQGIQITQFQGGVNSVRFSINGNKIELLNFLYSILKENRVYDFPLLSIRMSNNNEFQGTLEISRSILDSEPRVASYTEKLKQIEKDKPYDSTIKSVLGISFYKSIIEPEPEKVIEVAKVEYKALDKFSYVGLLKNNNKTVTMFKESTNGRVYKFEIGQTISQWTFLGKEGESFLFSKNNIIYEVKK